MPSACGIKLSFIVNHPTCHVIAPLNIIARLVLEEGVVRAGRVVRAVKFGYLVRLVCVCDEGVVGAGGEIKLEVLSRRTRKVALRIGSVLNHLADEPPIIDFTVEIQPARPRDPAPPIPAT